MGHEHSLSRQEIRAFRQRIADLGVEIAFGVAELCKLDNLRAKDLTFETVVSWKDLRHEFSLRRHEINRDRRQRFSDHRFVLMPIPMVEIRVWPRAGGLPAEWTDQCSIAELGRMLRDGDIIVPDDAHRLSDMLEFARTEPDRLDQLRSIPPIALPEFHTHRKELVNAPWTLDDGSHRALVLAMHGDTRLWCLAGFKRQESDSQVTDKLLTDLAGVHPDDRAALNRYLAQWEGRWRLAAAATPQDLSALALGQLPDLPIRQVDGTAVMQRVKLRRTHAEIARSAGLFHPTDNHGRTLATFVALAEFVRTKGTGAFNRRDATRQETQLEPGSEQDTARSAAGEIALAALDVGGASRSIEGMTLQSYPAVLDLVRDLASDRLLDKDADHVHAISAGAPALSDLAHASDQNGAGPWLGRQLARACIVAADAAQVHQDWASVQYRSTQAIAAILRHAGPPTPDTKFDDLMGLVRGFNRLGVSHRARWQEGLWRVEQAALHHETAIKLLSWCPKLPKPSREWSEYMLNCFSTLTNLASAWTEHTHASISSGLLETDDNGLLRARTLLMALREHQAYDRQVSAHAAMHGAGRKCSQNPARSLTCLPDHMLDLQLKGAANYKPWDWVLRNDLAEMNWRIGIHAMHDRRQSKWSPPGKRPVSPRLCLQNGLSFHVDTIKDLTKIIERSRFGSTDGANMKYWRWQHLANLRNKLEELTRDGHGRWLELGHEPCEELRHFESIAPNEYPAQQIATLDAYNEKDHEITLWTKPQNS